MSIIVKNKIGKSLFPAGNVTKNIDVLQTFVIKQVKVSMPIKIVITTFAINPLEGRHHEVKTYI